MFQPFALQKFLSFILDERRQINMVNAPEFAPRRKTTCYCVPSQEFIGIDFCPLVYICDVWKSSCLNNTKFCVPSTAPIDVLVLVQAYQTDAHKLRLLVKTITVCQNPHLADRPISLHKLITHGRNSFLREVTQVPPYGPTNGTCCKIIHHRSHSYMYGAHAKLRNKQRLYIQFAVDFKTQKGLNKSLLNSSTH